MIMARALLLITAVVSAAAAPAIIWKGGSSGSPVHSSENVKAASLLESTLDESLVGSSVVFVLGRDHNGNEGLSGLASSGKLPRTQAHYEGAHAIHHNVGGLESVGFIAKQAGTNEISLDKFNRMMTHQNSLDHKVVVVNVDRKDSPKDIDSAIDKAIERSGVHTVLLTAQRSTQEVQNERSLSRRKNKVISKKREALGPSRRRLEDQEEEEEAADDEEVVVPYYVNMTPNIFAGIMFTFLFITVTQIGLSCMGMIDNSDTFASKLPSVGREA